MTAGAVSAAAAVVAVAPEAAALPECRPAPGPGAGAGGAAGAWPRSPGRAGTHASASSAGVVPVPVRGGPAASPPPSRSRTFACVASAPAAPGISAGAWKAPMTAATRWPPAAASVITLRMCASRARSVAGTAPVSARSAQPTPSAARRTASGGHPGARTSTARSHRSSPSRPVPAAVRASANETPGSAPACDTGSGAGPVAVAVQPRSASGRSQQTTAAPAARAQRIAASSGEKSANG